MEYLPNGYTLEVPPGAFPFSTDSAVLAHFARLPKNARVLDLGSGCGTLGLLLCARDPGCLVTGIERDLAAHEAALKNIARNQLTGRMKSICADLRDFSQKELGQFSVCVSNPPYFSGGSSGRLADARQEAGCALDALVAAAGRAVQFGGDFFLVHKPEQLARIIALGAVRNLEAKRLLLLHHREGGPVNLIFLQLRKGGKPGLCIEEAVLFHKNGEPTPFYNSIYHF